MNREEYILGLFEKNKYCNCEDLSQLFSLEEKVKNLKDYCDDLFESLSGIHKENSEVHKLYDEKRSKHEGGCGKHSEELNSLIRKEKLKLFYHNEENSYKKQLITSDRVTELLKEEKIITVHCYNCDQQIGLISQREY